MRSGTALGVFLGSDALPRSILVGSCHLHGPSRNHGIRSDRRGGRGRRIWWINAAADEMRGRVDDVERSHGNIVRSLASRERDCAKEDYALSRLHAFSYTAIDPPAR